MFETLARMMREDHSPLEALRAAQAAQQRARLAEVDRLQCAPVGARVPAHAQRHGGAHR